MNDSTSKLSRVGTWALGRWRLEELLGRGGMASVYGAIHRSNGKRVAVKVLHAHLAAIPELAARFIQEGYAANRVEHPGAVSVIDEGTTEDGSPCLVMERLVGGTLDRWYEKRGPLPLFTTVLVLDRLLAVLAAAHRASIIHRDVKPENVFVTLEGAIKLLDFGIARAGDSTGTRTGATMGTPAYMSPEQAEGRWQEVDARTDVFAAGAVAIALLVAAPPRLAETANLVLLQAMSAPLPGLAARGVDVPSQIAAVIDRAVAWRRGDRFPSAAAMATALREAWASIDPRPVADHETHLAPLGQLLAGASADRQCTIECGPPDATALDVERGASSSLCAPEAFAAATHFATKESPLRWNARSVLALGTAFFVAVIAGVSITRWLAAEAVPARTPLPPVSAPPVSAPPVSGLPVSGLPASAPPAAISIPQSTSSDALPALSASTASESPPSPKPKRGPQAPARPSPPADDMLGHRK